MTRSIQFLTMMTLASIIIVAACDNTDQSRSRAQNADDGHGHGTETKQHVNMWEGVNKAIAVMSPTEGNQVRGTVTFEKVDDGVKVTWDVTGLNPNGQHAIHVHEFGDISAPDGTAAGSHYNPEGHDHGLPEQAQRHAGDFGNLQADGEGRAQDSLTVNNLSIADIRNPVIGRAVIIHANPDDGGQPVGNAGGRVSQGVIGVAK